MKFVKYQSVLIINFFFTRSQGVGESQSSRNHPGPFDRSLKAADPSQSLHRGELIWNYDCKTSTAKDSGSTTWRDSGVVPSSVEPSEVTSLVFRNLWHKQTWRRHVIPCSTFSGRFSSFSVYVFKNQFCVVFFFLLGGLASV